MCETCDGANYGARLARYAEVIRTNGFLVTSVEGPRGWSYTIGLLDSAGHPELIAVGGAAVPRAEMVHALGTMALDGERFRIGDTIDLGESLTATVSLVHPIHFQLDTFAMWQDVADIGAIHRHTPRAVQVLLPAVLLDGVPQPLLADPSARVGGAPHPNRRERRARRRRRRH